MEATAREELSTTKAKIIGYLKEYGESSVTQLADFLRISPMAVRKHLNSLTIQGIIATKKINKLVGRPTITYLMDNKKKNTNSFTVEILDSLKESQGEQAVVDLISKRNQKFLDRYKDRFSNKTTYEKIHEVAKIFNENGFDTVLEEDKKNKKIILRHIACPLTNITDKYPVICSFEIETIEALSGVKTNKICYFHSGNSCAYEFSI